MPPGRYTGQGRMLAQNFFKYFIFDDRNWDFHALKFDTDITLADQKRLCCERTPCAPIRRRLCTGTPASARFSAAR